MKNKPSLQDWLWVEAMLVNTLLGSITPNMRLIILAFEKHGWRIDVYLERDDPLDREEIEEIVDGLACDLINIHDKISRAADTKVFSSVIVSKDKINYENSLDIRPVYLKKNGLNRCPLP